MASWEGLPQGSVVSAQSDFLHSPSERKCQKLPGLPGVSLRSSIAWIQEEGGRASVTLRSRQSAQGGEGRHGGGEGRRGEAWARGGVGQGKGGGGGFGGGPLRVAPDPPGSSPRPVSLLTDLPVILITAVGGGAFLLFALGLILCLVKKK